MVPEGWRISTGAQIANKITKGASPKWQGFEYQDDGTLFVTSENVQSGQLDLTKKKYVSDAFANKIKSAKVLFGDILINIVGASIGRSCRFTEVGTDARVNQAVAVFRPSADVNSQFLGYYLQSDMGLRALFSSASSSARANLSLGDLRALSIPLPPLPEQRKIAEILSTWDKAIETTEALLANAEAQKRALMQNLLTGKRRFPEFEGKPWREVKLGEVAEILIGGTPSRSISEYWSSDGYIWLSISDLREKIATSSREKISASGVQNSNVKPVPKGTVLMSFKLSIGKIAIAGADLYTNEAICALPVKRNAALKPEFLYYLLHVSDLLADVDQAVKGKTLNKGKIADIHLTLPDLNEQEAITSVLATADALCANSAAQVKRMRSEKKALMQQLLTGKRRVKI